MVMNEFVGFWGKGRCSRKRFGLGWRLRLLEGQLRGAEGQLREAEGQLRRDGRANGRGGMITSAAAFCG